MKARNWRWISARSTGTSHSRLGKGCDDFLGCRECLSTNDEVLIAAISDGAGSAHLSYIGSRITSLAFCRAASRALRGQTLARITDDEISCWIDEIRDRIGLAAKEHDAAPRDFAATMIGVAIGLDEALIAHIGDGALVYRNKGDTIWRIASWPAQGEFAATTYFVTDDPSPNLVVTRVDGRIEEAAIFSDGLERLVLEFDSKTPFAPFFEKMFPILRTSVIPGRDRKISRQLKMFLESPSVNERTDDDKSVILARRVF